MSLFRLRNRVATSPDAADPRLRGLTFHVPFTTVWDAALELARSHRGWTVTDVDAREGDIAAETQTLVRRHTDDVLVRISLDEEGRTRVDMVSASRTPRHDLGTHERRIARFLHALRARLTGR